LRGAIQLAILKRGYRTRMIDSLRQAEANFRA
jgi:hypothetical protein